MLLCSNRYLNNYLTPPFDSTPKYPVMIWSTRVVYTVQFFITKKESMRENIRKASSSRWRLYRWRERGGRYSARERERERVKERQRERRKSIVSQFQLKQQRASMQRVKRERWTRGRGGRGRQRGRERERATHSITHAIHRAIARIRERSRRYNKAGGRSRYGDDDDDERKRSNSRILSGTYTHRSTYPRIARERARTRTHSRKGNGGGGGGGGGGVGRTDTYNRYFLAVVPIVFLAQTRNQITDL